MKRIILSASLIAISTALFAQKIPADAISGAHDGGGGVLNAPLDAKRDTVYVPLIEKDTIIPATLTYKGWFGAIKGKSGFVKLKGYVKAGSDQFVSQPQFVCYLNHRKREFKKKVLQAF